MDEISWVIKELKNKGWKTLEDEQNVFNQAKEAVDRSKAEGYEVDSLIQERDEFKRLYDFRGKVIKSPCSHCGKTPNLIKLAGE